MKSEFWRDLIVAIAVANIIWFFIGQQFGQETGFFSGLSYLSGYGGRWLLEWTKARDASSGRRPASDR